MSRQKITLSVLGILAVMLVLIGLFKLGLQSGQRQTATPTQTTKTAPSNSQSQTPTYTKAEYAMMAIMDYNHTQGTQIIDTLTFVEKNNGFEARDSNGPKPMTLKVGQKTITLTDENNKPYSYSIQRLSQQLQTKQAKADQLITKGRANAKKQTQATASSSSRSSTAIGTQHLTNDQAIAWIWSYYNQKYHHTQSTQAPTGDDGAKMSCENQYNGGLNPKDGLLYFRTQSQSGTQNAWWRINAQGELQTGIGVSGDGDWKTVATTYSGH